MKGRIDPNLLKKWREKHTEYLGTPPSAKLTITKAREIQARYGFGGVKQIELAREYGVSNQQISRIVRGEQWVGLRRESEKGEL